jgi:hypothetical protein
MSTDSNKLEHIQLKFAALRINHFFPHVHYSYALEHSKLHALLKKKYHLYALFLIQVNLASNFVVLFCKLLVFVFLLGISKTLLCSMSALKIQIVCPSARCTSVVNVVCQDTDVFGTKMISLHHSL